MKNPKRSTLLCLTAGMLMGVASSSMAASVGVNFAGRDPGFPLAPTETAGVVPQANWNNIPGEPYSGTTVELKDNSGAFTSVTLNYAASDSWHSDGPSGTPDEKLMKGIHKANPNPDLAPTGNTDKMVFTFNGLGTGAYDVIVYAMENGEQAQMSVNVGSTTYYLIESAIFGGFIQGTSTDPNLYEWGPNYVRFTGVTPTAGSIVITATKKIDDPQVNDGIGVPAIQLIAAGTIPANTTPAAITTQPTAQSVGAGESVTFTVAFTGPGNVQWQKDGVDIPGATSASYTHLAALSENGAKYRARISNNVNTVTSSEATLTVTALQLVQGFASADRWEGISGTAVQALIDAIGAGTAPNTSLFVNALSIPQTSPGLDNFGGRITGWLKPDVTGDYYFFLRSDDASQFFLNATAAASGTNRLPNVVTEFPIAQEDDCCDAFAEPDSGDPATTPTAVRLEAGKLYGFTVLYKEGGGDDYVYVAWRLATDTTPAGSLQPIPGKNLWTMASSAGKTAVISAQPVAATVYEAKPATFTVAVDTTPQAGVYSLQWYKDGVAIPGATGTTLTIPQPTLADNNAKIKAVALTLLGELTSTEVTLTVLPDTVPPVAVSAGAVKNAVGGVDVGVKFDEELTKATAEAAANYTIAGATISSVSYLSNSPGVVIRTTGLTAGNTYTVNVKNVTDAKGNAMPAKDLSFTVPNLTWNIVGGDDLGTGGFPNGDAVLAVSTNDFDLYSDGIGAWASYDESTFVYEQITGDFDKKVRIEYQDPASQWSRAGLIMKDESNFGVDRAGQEGGLAARYQKIHVSPFGPTRTGPGNMGANTHESNRRVDTGAATTSAALSANTSPLYPTAWVRLQRIGQTNNLFRSDDGVSWIYMGRTIWGVDSAAEMPATTYVGLDYAPENGNVTQVADRGRWMAKFRNYDNTFRPPVPAQRTYSIGLNFGADRAQGGIESALTATQTAGVPGVAQRNWNNLNAASGTQGSLVADANGTSQATTATATWAAGGVWTTQGDGEFNNVLQGADHTLMHAYLDTGDSTTTTVKIDNVPETLTSGGYDVYVYFAGGISGRGGGYRVVDGANPNTVLRDYVYARTQALPPVYEKVQDTTSLTSPGAGNYIVFRGLKAPSIQVEATTAGGVGTALLARGVGTPRAPINAIQLVAPGTAPPVTQPTISISTANGVVTITYTGTLQSSSNAASGYTDVAGASGGTYVVPTTGAMMFFRTR